MDNPRATQTQRSAKCRRGRAWSVAAALVFSQAVFLSSCNAGDESKKETPEAVSDNLRTKGGAAFVVRVTPAEGREVTPAMLAQTQAVLEKRLNPTGRRDVSITPRGTDRLFVEVLGLSEKETQETVSVIEKAAILEFRTVAPEGTQFTTKEDTTLKAGYVKMRYLDERSEEDSKDKPKGERWIWVKDEAALSGKSVSKAFHDLTPGETRYHIVIALHDEYGKKMEQLSAATLRKPLAIVLDGEVISAPTVNGKFGAHFEITGQYTEQQARELSSLLMNPLENPLKVEKSTFIAPSSTPKKP